MEAKVLQCIIVLILRKDEILQKYIRFIHAFFIETFELTWVSHFSCYKNEKR